MPRLTNLDPRSGHIIGERIRDCIIPYLEDLPHYDEDKPYRATVETGEVAWEDCRCGQLAVSLVSASPSTSFPVPRAMGDDIGSSPGESKCATPLFIFEYNVTVLNCAPSGGNSAKAPSPEAIGNAALISVADAWAVRAGLMCCFKQLTSYDNPGGKVVERFQIGTQTFVGPQGSCQGSELSVTVGIMNNCYPCIEDS